MGTSNTRLDKLESPYPTPEALIGVQLRLVEVEHIYEQILVSIGDTISKIDDSPQQNSEGIHNEGVRIDS